MSNPETLFTPSVLFEDTHVLVISKPAGLLSQGEHTGDSNVVDWARGHLGRNYVGLIHRLDRNTSGIMILAKRSKSANRLTEQLQSGLLTRSYLAWFEGTLEDRKHWRHWLKKDERINIVKTVSAAQAAAAHAKEASLFVTPLEQSSIQGTAITLARFDLETGRSHQIRVQAASEQHPLLGDRKYGGSNLFPRPALHSWILEFEHPMTGEKMSFRAPLPDDMRRLLRTPQNPTF